MDDELNAVRIFFKLKKNDNLSIEKGASDRRLALYFAKIAA